MVRDSTKGMLNFVVIMGDKVVELEVDPKRIPKIDIINLHQGISQFLYTDVLQAALQISKLTAEKKSVEEMLWKDRVGKRAYHTQIGKLQIDLSIWDIPKDKGISTQRLLKDKEGMIQLLKEKLEIHSTRLIQTTELTDTERDKVTLNTELIDCKEKLLIQEGKER